MTTKQRETRKRRLAVAKKNGLIKKPPSKLETQREARSLWNAVGPEGLITILSDLKPDPDTKEGRLLDMLLDPSFERHRLVSLCRESGMSIKDLKSLYVDYQLSKGHMAMYQHIPKVMEDTAIAATERKEKCTQCDGLGHIETAEETLPCPAQCKDGWEIIRADPSARSIVFDSAGLTGKKGPLVAIQNNTNVSVAPPSLESIIEESQKVIDVSNAATEE